MSLQWQLIAGFLYSEILIVLLLILPIGSPRKWNAIFKSKLIQFIRNKAGTFFVLLLGILILFLLDAVKDMKKYANPYADDYTYAHVDKEMQGNMKLFRAQRNFYISGFALFLSFVIRKFVSLISSQAVLLAQAEASLQQARGASNVAKNFLDLQTDYQDGMVAHIRYNQQEDTESLRCKIRNLESALSMEEVNKSLLKEQIESLSKEYEKLTIEHNLLQNNLNIAGAGDKKLI